RKFDNPSAMPSTIPSEAAPALRTAVKNAGKTENTISEEKSLKRLVSPRKKMFRGKPKMRDSLLICAAETIQESVAKEHSPVFRSVGVRCGGIYQIPGSSRDRVFIAYSAYPESSFRSVRSSRAVRTTNRQTV